MMRAPEMSAVRHFAMAVLLSVVVAHSAMAETETDPAYEARQETTVDAIHGRIAYGGLWVNDSSDQGNRDLAISHVYYRLVGERLFGRDDIEFNLDGRYRAAHGRDWNHKMPSNRLLMANVKIKKIFDRVDLTLGRSFMEEFVTQGVDGVDAKIWLTKFTALGLFGGLRPDPFDDRVNPDFTTYGAYASTKTDYVGGSVGYAIDNFKGQKDRERANAALYLMPATQWWHLMASVDADHDFDASHDSEHGAWNKWFASNTLVHLTARPVDWLSISGTYNDFMAINRELSIEEAIGEENYSEERYAVSRLRLEVRPIKVIGVYGGFDNRWREHDGKNANQYYVGVRDYNFFFNTTWDFRYANMEWFTSDVQIFTGSVGVSLDRADANITVTKLTNQQQESGSPNELSQWIYEASGTFWLSKHLYGTVQFSYSQEEFLDVDSIYSSRYDTNFTTTTLYGQVGYRF